MYVEILDETTNVLAEKLSRTIHQCAYDNLINFLLKKHNVEDLSEI